MAPVLALSSNWKLLQSTLQHDKRTSHPSSTPSSDSTLKRKRAVPSTTPAARNDHPKRRRKMNPALPSAATTIPPSPPTTERNIGLHPTHQPGRYLALDCEMVATARDTSSLARASLVNYHGQVVYDSFVLPSVSDPVVDYKTGVSGVRAMDLRGGYARPLERVRADVAALLAGRVLVGHALRNDLQALGMGHPGYAVRDTARYSGFRVWAGGRTPALRVLAEKVLGVEIQGAEHDSVVDARTAMQLYRLEKGGMEDEVRKKYGALVGRRGVEVLKGRGALGGVEDGLGEEEERETIDGESEGEDGLQEDEDEQTQDGAEVTTGTAKKKRKKKRKHKSRTTRA